MNEELPPWEIFSAIEYAKLRDFVEHVAHGKRPDGTYNYCRAALEIKAKLLLNELQDLKRKSLNE